MYLAPLNYDRFFKKVFSDTKIAKQFLEDFFEFEIEEITQLPNEHKLTNEANVLSFDYRCKVKGNYMVVDMQQWYKHDVVKRFYLYHGANTVLQLEDLPYKKVEKERKIKDYSGLLPVITLIWMVDDGLKFNKEAVGFTMLPTELFDFLVDETFWENKDCDPLLKKRTELLKIVNNDTKGLDFLRKNELIFAFQRQIIKEHKNREKDKPYKRWFVFANKTRYRDNAAEDFIEFEDDPIFSEIIRKLRSESLNPSDWDYIHYYDEMLGVMEAKIRDSRVEGRKEGKKEGRKEGKEIGTIQRNVEIAIDFLEKMPSWTNQQISEWAKLEEEKVAKIRKAFNQNNSEVVKSLIPLLFNDISGISREDISSLKVWVVKLWYKYKEKQ